MSKVLWATYIQLSTELASRGLFTFTELAIQHSAFTRYMLTLQSLSQRLPSSFLTCVFST